MMAILRLCRAPLLVARRQRSHDPLLTLLDTLYIAFPYLTATASRIQQHGSYV